VPSIWIPTTRGRNCCLAWPVLNNGSHDKEGVEYLRAAALRSSAAHVILAAYYARAGLPDAAEREARVYLGPEGSSDPVVLHNWIESMARSRPRGRDTRTVDQIEGWRGSPFRAPPGLFFILLLFLRGAESVPNPSVLA
jgi:hypothetical protein